MGLQLQPVRQTDTISKSQVSSIAFAPHVQSSQALFFQSYISHSSLPDTTTDIHTSHTRGGNLPSRQHKKTHLHTILNHEEGLK